MNDFTHFKPITAEQPRYDIKHLGQLPGVCFNCNRPPVEFIVFANQHLAFVRFYCPEHYGAAVHEQYPDGLPWERMGPIPH